MRGNRSRRFQSNRRPSFSNATLPFADDSTPVETTRTRSDSGGGGFSDIDTGPEPEFVEAPPPSRPANGPNNIFYERVKRDPKVMGLFTNLKNGTYTLDLAGMTRELYHIQSDRILRHPQVVNRVLQEAQSTLIKADMQHAAGRSRAAEIRMHCYELRDVIDELMEAATDYMLARYQTELKNSGFSTKSNQTAAIDHVLTQFRKRKRELDRVIELSKLVIDDIDKASFNINHTIEVLKLNISRSRNL